jgi:micrococcal nuclease
MCLRNASDPFIIFNMTVKNIPKIIFGLLLIIIGLFVFKRSNRLTQTLNTDPKTDFDLSEPALVKYVFDGDTLEVELAGKTERVRLIGIDSPELENSQKKADCYADEAKQEMKKLVSGKQVLLKSDQTQDNRDMYNRLLRYVYLNGLNINIKMISEGFAYEYTYKNNPYVYQLEFKTAQDEARSGKLGLWADNICN